MAFVIKNTTEYRLEDMAQVEKFHKKLQKQAETEGYTLSAFSWTTKDVKEKGEVVETYYQVRVTFIFNELKAPENMFCRVEFPYGGFGEGAE